VAEYERAELADHMNRGRELLTHLKDSEHRRTILALITYLETKLAAMDGRPG
jgi:hypothetical protein